MKCPRCNTDLVTNARFCGICGYSLPTVQDNASHSPIAPGNNEATLVAASWPGVQPAQGPHERMFVPRSPLEGAPAINQVPAPAQAEMLQHPPQTQAAYPPGMVPGSMSSAGAINYPIRRRRGGRVLFRVFLALVLLLAILAGAWVLGVRPYLHNIVQAQLDQALNGAEGQMLLFQVALPGGGQVVHIGEDSMNTYLSAHDISPLQNLHATITPGGLQLDFSAYSFTNTIIVVPIASGGGLQVTNVQVQGVLWLVMSNDELTTALNTNFQNFGHLMSRTIRSITLHEHEMDVQIQ